VALSNRGLINLKIGFPGRTSSGIFSVSPIPGSHHGICDKEGLKPVFSGPDFGKNGGSVGIRKADCSFQRGQTGPQEGVGVQFGL
jgi:hypothetical protein